MQGAVLVLNANFEPLNVCNIHRAVGLMMMGKAILVLNGRGEMRSCFTTHPIPSVIRLEQMVHRPHQTVKLCKREILRRDRYTCQYCGRRSTHMTVDHIIPKHMGGTTSWDNMTTACPSCNHRKGGRTLEQARMSLIHNPGRPPDSANYLYAHYLIENSEWEDFISGW